MGSSGSKRERTQWPPFTVSCFGHQSSSVCQALSFMSWPKSCHLCSTACPMRWHARMMLSWCCTSKLRRGMGHGLHVCMREVSLPNGGSHSTLMVPITRLRLTLSPLPCLLNLMPLLRNTPMPNMHRISTHRKHVLLVQVAAAFQLLPTVIVISHIQQLVAPPNIACTRCSMSSMSSATRFAHVSARPRSGACPLHRVPVGNGSSPFHPICPALLCMRPALSTSASASLSISGNHRTSGSSSLHLRWPVGLTVPFPHSSMQRCTMPRLTGSHLRIMPSRWQPKLPRNSVPRRHGPRSSRTRLSTCSSPAWLSSSIQHTNLTRCWLTHCNRCVSVLQTMRVPTRR